ncbi:hypothetical protein STANM309S_06433 [Streptomyces tanashiensis]
MTDSKNINNPVGQGGGQRKRQSRAERQNNGPHRNLDRQGAADKKAELVRKMREKTRIAEDAGQAGDDTAQAGGTAATGRHRTGQGPDRDAWSRPCCRIGDLLPHRVRPVPLGSRRHPWLPQIRGPSPPPLSCSSAVPPVPSPGDTEQGPVAARADTACEGAARCPDALGEQEHRAVAAPLPAPTGQDSRSPGRRAAPSVMVMATTTSTAAHTSLASVTLEVPDIEAARRFYSAFGVGTSYACGRPTSIPPDSAASPWRSRSPVRPPSTARRRRR